MKVVVLHSEVLENASKDEEDVLVQVDSVSRALGNLGYDPVALPFTIDTGKTIESLRAIRPLFIFNLVETVQGTGRLIYLAPAILDHLKIGYTGAGTEALFLTSNKLMAKKLMKGAGISSPPWFSMEDLRSKTVTPECPFIIKSVWEHASVGLDEDSVIPGGSAERLILEMEHRLDALGGNCFAEAYIEGREFNLSILAAGSRPEVLPPAEIRFDFFAEGKMKVVGYRAKWDPDSFEYHNTPRCFDFPEKDDALLCRLTSIARECWRLFGLQGYARVDFRVDNAGTPWVLEVNANPCLSPDAGFSAAAKRAGISFDKVIRRIVSDAQSLKR